MGVGGEGCPFAGRTAFAPGAAAMVAERVRALLLERDRLSIEIAAMVGDLARAGFGISDGRQGMVEWVRHECHQSFSAAFDLVATGLHMGFMPDTLEAVDEGEVGFGHLALMARTAHQMTATGTADDFDETHLLAEAREHSVSHFMFICQEYRHSADPNGVEDERRALHERRGLSINNVGNGMVGIRGMLDPEGGALVKAALAPLAERLAVGDDRTVPQRMADALVEVVGRNSHAHVHVTANLGTLLQVAHSAPSELAGQLVSAETLRRMTCECSVARVLFKGDSVLIDMGRERRVVSPAQRRALELRDRHCRWPGCTRKANWCQAHHIVHWADGGPSDLDQMVLLCSYHHRLVHEGRWKLVMREGRLTPLRPPLDFLAPPRGAPTPLFV